MEFTEIFPDSMLQLQIYRHNHAQYCEVHGHGERDQADQGQAEGGHAHLPLRERGGEKS